MPNILNLEILAVPLSIAVALIRPKLGEKVFHWFECVASRLAQRRTVCWIGVAVLAIAIRAELLPIAPIPRPTIQDEFAYLLGGETFALGRITNPTPALWPFFESAHVLLTPTYQSKYPPGQSLVLALGKVLLGNLWFGVLLSCGAMVGAICWMLQGWMPARWALLGASLAMLHLAMTSYWMNSYWGGAVAGIGGCLVMGAYPRIVRRRRYRYAWLIGVGLIILANTRPLEGAVASVPFGVGLLLWGLRRTEVQLRTWVVRVAAPIACCLMVGGAFMLYYNFRVTGHALRMPHVEHTRQYEQAPMLLIFPLVPAPKTYHSVDMAYQYGCWDPQSFNFERHHYLSTKFGELLLAGQSLGILIISSLLAAPLVWRDHRMRLLWVSLGMTGLLWSLENTSWLHYVAPETGAFFALLVQSTRHLRAGRSHLCNAGRCYSRLVVAVSLCLLPYRYGRLAMMSPAALDESLSPLQHKPEVEATLLSRGGRCIVFVHCHVNFAVMKPVPEWVSNPPDIAKAPVIWAQDLGPQADRALLNLYPDRKAWIFQPNAVPPTFDEYPRQNK